MCSYAPANISEIIVHLKKINIYPTYKIWLNCKPGERHGSEGEENMGHSHSLLTFSVDCSA